jgi:hypothetical protein
MKNTVNAAASALLALANRPEAVSRMSVTSRPDVIRVILADDHLVVRAGLKALLGTS